jgi:hypothetical protein
MSYLVGQPILPEELEWETGSWSPERFASLCNDISWAVSGRSCLSLPSFTTRVNVKDGGIDAEFDVPKDDSPPPNSLVGPGWNVFQYKKREYPAQDRRKIVTNLKSLLRGAVEELRIKSGRYPDRYVLFVNIHLNIRQLEAIRKSILGDAPPNGKTRVEIVHAALLAVFLNDNPHLRAAYFANTAFKTWEEANRSHRSQKRFGSSVDFTGREQEIDRLRQMIDDPQIRVIVLSGSHDVGKSRLALEATGHRKNNVVVALDPRSMTPGEYRLLCGKRDETVCIVEDPDLDAVSSIANEALALPNLKLLITVPAPQRISKPSYGYDDRFQSIHVDPLSENDSYRLLEVIGRSLDFGISDWIVRNSGGLPGVLLAAASVGADLRSTQADFSEAVGREFELRLRNELGENALHYARLFSIMTHVGITGRYEAELESLCRNLDNGASVRQAIEVLPDLESAGLTKRTGSFVEITPLILARYFSQQLLSSSRPELFALFRNLREAARLRLIERIGEAGGEHAEMFWSEMVAPDGLFKDLAATLSAENSILLKFLAASTPRKVLAMLNSQLLDSSLKERLEIQGNARRELMWALEQLLFRRKTSAGALRLLWLLAEAENETYGNNATEVFRECFCPLHPQMPLPLSERLDLLGEFTAPRASVQGRVVALKAALDALDSIRSVRLRQSYGPDPLDSVFPLAADEARNYAKGLVELCFRIAGEEGDVAVSALEGLPTMAAQFAAQVSLDGALEWFRLLIEWLRAGRKGLDISNMVAQLLYIEKVLSERLERNPADDKTLELISSYRDLRSLIESAEFSIRLKNWTGSWKSVDLDLMENKPGGRAPIEIEAEKLAAEAVGKPEALTEDLIQWLLSPAAERAHLFFYHLGRNDELFVYRSRMECLGQAENGARAFSAYIGGWASRDRCSAESRLDQLADSNIVTGESILQATSWIGASASTVSRIVGQIQSGRISHVQLASSSFWIKDLSEEDFERLLRAVAGSGLEHAMSAVRIFGTWIHFRRVLTDTLADFAWQCLLSRSASRTPNQDWYCDRLAARLAESDRKRAFEKIEELLVQPAQEQYIERNCWEPFDLPRTPELWKVLHATDSERLYRIFLQAARIEPGRFLLFWRIKDLVDCEADRDVLVSLAHDNIESARTIASWLQNRGAGFWPLVLELHQIFPYDEQLHEILAAAIERRDLAFVGSISESQESMKREVEEKLRDASTPSSARTWLREIADRLSDQTAKEIIWEYDLNIDDVCGFIRDRNSPQRMWALSRVLKYAKMEDIRRLLTIEDIEEALPVVDLPQKRRKALQQALPIWRHAS